MMFIRPSVWDGRALWSYGALLSADLSLRLDSPISGHPDTKACPPTASRLFPVPPGTEVEYGCTN